MSFEQQLSDLIRSAGLPAPEVGERREEAWPKIIAAFEHLIRIAMVHKEQEEEKLCAALRRP